MCILCVVQKWSRRIATMLPWLVIPLIGLWALSQLLPPALRFEVTSPRLACVLVLLVTLFWYEILMPQLSAWRARRSARLREKRRFEAMEMQKLRKTATRRCRNCLTAYREQNPGGGRFMCSYCGHVSRRPVLEIPGGVLGCKNMEGIGASGIMGDLVGKGGKIWNGKVWTERQGWGGSGNGWFCGDWSENVNWAGGTFPGKSNYWGKSGGVFGSTYLSGDDRCLAEKSYSGVAVFGGRLLGVSLVSIRWLWRKVFRVGSSGEDPSSDSDNRANLRKGEGGLGFQESKGEKARRKAEEKRQARLEREMLEEEERKQREEVARLVEERRRLRDEKTDAEKEHVKGPGLEKDRDSKREKESEKKRHEKAKDRDRLSSTDRSNSEGEEADKRSSRENEKKREFDRKIDGERKDSSKHSASQAIEVRSPESFRIHGSDTGHGGKGSNNASKVGASRYFDRMRGSFLSSSKALGGSALTPFFGRGVQAGTQTPATKVSKPGSGDHVHTHSTDLPVQQPKPTSTSVWDGMLPSRLRADVIDGNSETSPKRVPACANTSEMHLNEYKTGRPSSGNGDSKSSGVTSQATVHVEPQSGAQLSAPKKSWQHLFSRTKTTSMLPNTKPDSQAIQVEFGGSHLPELASPTHSLHNQHSVGFSTPVTIPSIPISSVGGCSMPKHTFEPGSFTLVDPVHDHIVKGESFDDIAYITDPVSLLGPVSESLDNFSLDIGTGFLADAPLEKTRTLKKVCTSAEVVRPSPIESPVSKLLPQGCADEVNSGSGQFSCSPKSSDSNGNTHEQGTWHMWDTPPIVQDGLGLIGSPSAWLLPTLNSNPASQDILHPLPHSSVFSQTQFAAEDQLVPCSHSPPSFCSSYGPRTGAFESIGPSLNGEDPWQQKSIFQPLPEGDGHFSQHKQESFLNKEVTCDTATRQAGSQTFEPSPGGWSRNNWVVDQTGNGAANGPPMRPHIGSLFSTPDVQSLWSYK
ncbi:hypothetical protein EJ110_NYTH09240 [Nymphaea thermarum]|nr:hypothetical protein EJ110_NYTH09240 [Nymphaea thermarum]